MLRVALTFLIFFWVLGWENGQNKRRRSRFTSLFSRLGRLFLSLLEFAVVDNGWVSVVWSPKWVRICEKSAKRKERCSVQDRMMRFVCVWPGMLTVWYYVLSPAFFSSCFFFMSSILLGNRPFSWGVQSWYWLLAKYVHHLWQFPFSSVFLFPFVNMDTTLKSPSLLIITL